jgi:hypothetical protein
VESSYKPSLLFRSIVIVSVVALVLGVAGIFYFEGVHRTPSDGLPHDACIVMVNGLPSLAGIEVRATWLDTQGKGQEETGSGMAEAGYWTLRRVPEGSPIQLHIVEHAAGQTRTVHRQPAVLTRGGVFEIRLRAPK